jgi:X-Pro dipeptidyl-peptidase (S15 family)
LWSDTTGPSAADGREGSGCPIEFDDPDWDGPESAIALPRHASVESYMSRIRIPTLLAQGEADTSVLAAEAVATYEALRAQDTPVKMIWQSWGHSNETPAPGELGKLAGGYAIYDSAGHLTYEGETVLQWFGHCVRNGRPGQPAIGT